MNNFIDVTRPRTLLNFLRSYFLWLIIILLPVLFFASKIIIEEKPLGHNNSKGEGYFLVTKLFGNKSIYSFKEGYCWPGGGWGCGMIKQPVENAEVSSFKTLGLRHAVDANNVYYDWGQRESKPQIIYGAKVDSLVVLDATTAKDDTYVYLGDSIISGANPVDYKIVVKDQRISSERYPYNISISGDKVFLGNRSIDYAIRDGVYIIDPDLKSALPCKNQQPYSNGEHKGYYSCDLTETGEDEIIEIDAKTLTVVSSGGLSSTVMYVKDSRFVYHIDFDRCNNPYAQARGKCNYLNVVEGSDPATFRIDEGPRGYKPSQDAKDDNSEYSSGGCKILGVHSTRRTRGLLEDGRCFYY